MGLKEIVQKYLEENNFTGLCNSENCGCNKDDLFPCENPMEECEPAIWLDCCDCDNTDCHHDLTLWHGCYIVPKEPELNLLDSREKAIPNKIYTINGQDYFAQKTELGCQGCVSDCENSEPKCTDFPLCSSADLSVIFIKVEK